MQSIEEKFIMKNIIIVISIIFIAITSAFIGKTVFGADETQVSPSVGRFQLLQGTFTALDHKNNRADKDSGIFLLDTSTGRVQSYLTGISKDGKFFEKWVDVGAFDKSK